jgi:ABC-type spermidine/putrescine transport system permease subunit II
MTDIRHSLWNRALHVEMYALLYHPVMFECTYSINPPGTNSWPDLLHTLKDYELSHQSDLIFFRYF